jgi:hypothetical protein
MARVFLIVSASLRLNPLRGGVLQQILRVEGVIIVVMEGLFTFKKLKFLSSAKY